MMHRSAAVCDLFGLQPDGSTTRSMRLGPGTASAVRLLPCASSEDRLQVQWIAMLVKISRPLLRLTTNQMVSQVGSSWIPHAKLVVASGGSTARDSNPAGTTGSAAERAPGGRKRRFRHLQRSLCLNSGGSRHEPSGGSVIRPLTAPSTYLECQEAPYMLRLIPERLELRTAPEPRSTALADDARPRHSGSP